LAGRVWRAILTKSESGCTGEIVVPGTMHDVCGDILGKILIPATYPTAFDKVSGFAGFHGAVFALYLLGILSEIRQIREMC
jgi:hypothetical protein